MRSACRNPQCPPKGKEQRERREIARGESGWAPTSAQLRSDTHALSLARQVFGKVEPCPPQHSFGPTQRATMHKPQAVWRNHD